MTELTREAAVDEAEVQSLQARTTRIQCVLCIAMFASMVIFAIILPPLILLGLVFLVPFAVIGLRAERAYDAYWESHFAIYRKEAAD